ncbi:MAG: hypothetical protein K2M63_08955 [Muribaculaceae bacterium]|nr:hypothetical protein [Muribaculaceae bacterium]
MENQDKDIFSTGCADCRSGGCHHGSGGSVGCEACVGCPRREPRGKLVATDWLADIPGDDKVGIVQVLFKNTRAGFYLNTANLPLKIGDIVAVEAAPGHDIGKVTMVGPLVHLQMKKNGIRSTSELKKVFRLARPADIEKFEEARAREHSTMIKARRIAEELGLAMKIGDVEYQGDGGKAIFYYIADERVDFRKLIRVLADTFKVRIEMKQIGARQEAGRIGGIGPCGRPLCCSSWMSRFVSVGTGAARVQDLSMNPQKLAGQCGKLKCCLNFEIDAYAEAQKELPTKDITLETKDATYFLFKTDILARTVSYSTDKGIPANLVTIDARRAFEIIALNKQGIRVESLAGSAEKEEPQKEYGDIIGQDSLTRFDKTKKKKKKKKPQAPPTQGQPKAGDARQQPKPGAPKPPKESKANPQGHAGQNQQGQQRPPRQNRPQTQNQKKNNKPKPQQEA